MNIKKIFNYTAIILFVIACTDNLRDISFIEGIQPATNVSALFNITQDNTGTVTITPNADGATSFEIFFGDGSGSAKVAQGANVQHVYAEGNYDVKVIAINLNGVKTEKIEPLVVSFIPPQNLVVTIQNDPAVSKKVNITASADFATMFEFDSGETGVTQPVVSGNIGNTISYTYATAGTYNVKVTAKGGAIATTEYAVSFTVTEILAPTTSAPNPPSREAIDVISIYSSAYSNVAGTDTFPDWGQAGQGSSWAEFDLNGDKMLQYIKLSYQGIQFGSRQNVSGMEFLHLDVWTSANGDITSLETSLINITNTTPSVSSEKPVTKNIAAGQWTSLDIPIADYTSQGLTVSEIFQLKFVGTPWASGTVFIDNIYFYKSPTSPVSMIQNFEGTAPAFTVFGNIAATEVVANPDASGINTTSKVAKLTKSSGSEVWAGTFFQTNAPLNLANFPYINIKTWSPKANAMVKVKLENQNASITHEVDMFTTTANKWESISYDFSGAPAADYVRIVVFFDFGNAGDGSSYYFDEISIFKPKTFQNFEGTAPTFTVFGNIAATEVVANPNASGINTSSKVAKLTKSSGSEVWAGTFFQTSEALDFTDFKSISMKTWSPKAGAVVKMKLENQDASITHEVDVNTTQANSWQKLVYDFSGAPAANYVRVVVFFDFGNAGDGSVYYFDDLTLTK